MGARAHGPRAIAHGRRGAIAHGRGHGPPGPPGPPDGPSTIVAVHDHDHRAIIKRAGHAHGRRVTMSIPVATATTRGRGRPATMATAGAPMATMAGQSILAHVPLVVRAAGEMVVHICIVLPPQVNSRRNGTQSGAGSD